MSKTKGLFKLFSLLLIAVLSIGLVACGESDVELAEKVDALIEELPADITLDNEATLIEVRETYNGLTAEQKKLVTKLADLEAKENKILDLKAAAAVIGFIDDVLPSSIVLGTKATVDSVKAAYDELTSSQKELVTNYSKLEAAVATIAELEKEVEDVEALITALPEPNRAKLGDREAVMAAREAYDALVGAQKEIVKNYSKLQDVEAVVNPVVNVINLIDALPLIDDLTLEHESAILAARAAYDKLTSYQKSLVTNRADLPVIEENFEILSVAADVSRRIENLPTNINLGHKVFIVELRNSYEELTLIQKELVTNLAKLEAAEATIVRLEQDIVDKDAALRVENLIKDIPLPGILKLEDEQMVVYARTQYDALTETQKALVPNLGTLAYAESRIKDFADKVAAEAVDDLIYALPLPPEITLAYEPAILTARAAYEALTEDQKDDVMVLNLLELAEAALAKLKE